MLSDMESGRERMLWDGLDRDQQEAWAIYGTYQGYAWTPDGQRIVISAQGKFWSVELEGGRATPIPFTARVTQVITDAVRFPQQVAPDSFDVKMLRWVSVSPDQRTRDVPGARPDLGEGPAVGHAASPDECDDTSSSSRRGRRTAASIVYATWDDDSLGAIRTISADGRNARVLTRSARPLRRAALLDRRPAGRVSADRWRRTARQPLQPERRACTSCRPLVANRAS